MPLQRVGIQGEAGCFSAAAAALLLGDRVEVRYHRSFEAVLAGLDAGDIDRALLPVHNSLAGVVAESLAAISRHDVQLVGEQALEIHLVLAALPGADLDDLVEVRSHPVALRQCRKFFEHHPSIMALATDDTAGAAREARELNRSSVGAVTTRAAARAHGLKVIAETVQDRTENQTRFWLLARRNLSPVPLSRQIELAHGGAVKMVAAVRGATTVSTDEPAALSEAARELLMALLATNGLEASDIVSAVFTATPDLHCRFPAEAARELDGWRDIPLLCAQEMEIDGALQRCIRVLLHAQRAESDSGRMIPVYLRNARALRPDL